MTSGENRPHKLRHKQGRGGLVIFVIGGAAIESYGDQMTSILKAYMEPWFKKNYKRFEKDVIYTRPFFTTFHEEN